MNFVSEENVRPCCRAAPKELTCNDSCSCTATAAAAAARASHSHPAATAAADDATEHSLLKMSSVEPSSCLGKIYIYKKVENGMADSARDVRVLKKMAMQSLACFCSGEVKEEGGEDGDSCN